MRAKRAGALDAGQPLVAKTTLACQILGIPTSGPLVVGCSGGSDSAAALNLLRRALPQAELVACYVDHGIRPRPSIARDIAAVRAQAASAAAKVHIERVRVSQGSGSREARARERRYAALVRAARAHASGFVISAHQQDDVAESLLLALARGSGIDGTVALRARRPLAQGVILARPFLWATRAELADYAATLGLAISEDETNVDPRIRRNAVRALLDGLERRAPGSRRAIARSAALLAGDKAMLDGLTLAAWDRCRVPGSDELLVRNLRGLSMPLLRRVIRLAVRQAAGARDFHLVHCDAIARAIESKRGGTFHAGSSAQVMLSAGRMRVIAVGPRDARSAIADSIIKGMGPRDARSATLATFSLPAVGKVGTVAVQGGEALVRWATRPSGGRGTWLRSSLLKPGMRMEIRTPLSGDVCVPAGHHRPVSLARYLAKRRVPRDERMSKLVLIYGDRVAAVLGIAVMEPFAAKQGRILGLRWRRKPPPRTTSETGHRPIE